MKVVSFIMYYAPSDLLHFAALVGEFGPQLLGTYSERNGGILSSFSNLFLCILHILCIPCRSQARCTSILEEHGLPTVTSLATCSSAASIPANLEATKKMGISSDVRETVVLLGSTLHKDGSVFRWRIKNCFLIRYFQHGIRRAENISNRTCCFFISRNSNGCYSRRWYDW